MRSSIRFFIASIFYIIPCLATAQVNTAPESNSVESRFFSLARFGPVFDDHGGSFSLSTINDFALSESLFAGFGAELQLEGSVPLFADVHYEPLQASTRPSFFAQVGYNSTLERTHYRSGFYSAIGAGLVTPLWGRTSFTFDISYRYSPNYFIDEQRVDYGTYTHDYFFTYSNLSAMGVNVGIRF